MSAPDIILSGTLTADTSATAVGTYWPGGYVQLLAPNATWGGGTLTVQLALTASDTDADYIDIDGISLTNDGYAISDDPIAAGVYVRVQLDSSTDPSIPYRVCRVLAGPSA